MGRMLFKQPNGLYCVYSSISESIIYYNLTKESYIGMRMNELREELEKMFDEEETDRWKGTNMADIKDPKLLIGNIFPYNWSKETYKFNIKALKEMGHSEEDINMIKKEYKNRDKE